MTALSAIDQRAEDEMRRHRHKANGAEPSEPVRQNHFLQWGVLSDKTPPAREWRIKDWLTTGGTLFSGKGGSGKTTLAQCCATSLATGMTYLEAIDRPAVNLMWCCEDDHDELWRRQVQICTALNLEMRSLEDMFYLESRLGCDNTLYASALGRPIFTPVFDVLKEQIRDVGADVVWLDNVGHTFGGNENDRHQVTEFINKLMGIREGRPISVVLLAHPARNSGSEYAGSAAWENAVRTRWYFGEKLPDQADSDEEPDADVRYLCRRKANYTFRDYLKFEFRNGVFMPEQREATPFSERFGGQARREDLDSILLTGFDKCLAAGITPTDGPTSPDYLPRRLVDMKLNVDRTKKELATAMHRLLADGRLKRAQVGTYSNRNPKFGLVRS